MDRLVLIWLLSLPLLGCGPLWGPACLSDPQSSGCRVEYRVAPDYALNNAAQSWVLNPPPPGVPENLDLPAHGGEIVLSLLYGNDRPSEMITDDARKIRHDGRIEIFHSSQLEASEKLAGISLILGATQPQPLPLRRVDLGCTANGYSTNLGMREDGSIIVWGGLRQKEGVFSFVTNDVTNRSMNKLITPATEFLAKNSNPISQGTVGIQMGCQVVVTKNSTFEYCPVGDGHLLIADENKDIISDTGCSNYDKEVYCTRATGKVIAYSAIDDSVAIAIRKEIDLLSIAKIGSKFNFSKVTTVPGIDLKFLILNDINDDGRADAISSTVQGDISVYLQDTSGRFILSPDHGLWIQSALNRLQVIHAGPVGALAVGHIFSADTLDLIVATESAQATRLWLLASDPALPEPWQLDSGLQPPGVAGIGSPFAEPVLRLELGDMDGDGRTDLVYVSPKAAHFCITHVDAQ